MKNIGFIFFVVNSFYAEAQITVSNNDFVPIGRTFVMAFDTASRMPGNAGQNQIWNFSNLQSNFVDTVLVTHPDSTPYSGYFPSANVGFGSPSSMYYQYFNNSSTAFYLLGMIVVTTPNPPSTSTFIPPSKYFEWPVNYLDAFADSCINISIYPSIGPNGTDTSKYVSHYKEQNSVDAWGTITTPAGTFNCLRQKKIQARIDSSWFFDSQAGTWSFMNTYSDTTVFYDWVSNSTSAGFILAEISYFKSSNTYSGVYWMKNMMAGIEEPGNLQTISVYPNPCSDILMVQTSRRSLIELWDTKGILLRKWEQTSLLHSTDISSLSDGIYLLVVKDIKDSSHSVFKKIIIGK